MDRLQFGQRRAGVTYTDRQAAFGVIAEEEGLIAVAAITLSEGQPPVYDLPGGGVDPGESESEALVREFGEETGLKVRAGDLLLRASQYWVKPSGEAVNNHSAFFAGEILHEAHHLKIEEDHALVLMSPEDFIRRARHEAQAWAVCVWLRTRR